MTSTIFLMERDIAGNNGFGIPFSADGYSMLLAANVAQSVVVPSNYPMWIAVFGYTPGATIWVDGTKAAVIPTGAASASTARINPSARRVKAGQTISFITADATSPVVCVEFLIVTPYGN